MDILLTDEGIREIRRPMSGQNNKGVYGWNEVGKEIARAQLKKVVEWLNENGMVLCSCDEDGDGLTYRIPFKTLQALKKEAGIKEAG